MGSATMACPSGTRIHHPRMSTGPRKDAMSRPKPIVTADTPRGSASAASIQAPRVGADMIPAQASAPRMTAKAVATAAY